jgi:hypothetical protein
MKKKFKTKIILITGAIVFLALLSVCSNYSWIAESPLSTMLIYGNLGEDSPEEFKRDNHLLRTVQFIGLLLSPTSFFENPIKISFQYSSRNQRALLLRC